MTAGPRRCRPRVVSGDGRADPLPPRSGVHRGLRARPRPPAAGLPDRQRRCSASPPRARARWSRPSPTCRVPGEPAVVASCGKFGERWAELCDAYGAETVTSTSSGARRSTRPASTRRSLRLRPPAARRLRDAVGDLDRRPQRRPRPSTRSRRGHGAVLCVDAVSGLGAVDLPQDEWGVDVVVSGSQKSLMCPPGLGVRLGLASARWRSPPRARGAATTSTGRAPPRASARRRRTRLHPRGDPVPGARRRARADLRRGPRRGLRPPRRARARPRAPASRRSASSASAPTTRTPTSSPRRRFPDEHRRRRRCRS